MRAGAGEWGEECLMWRERLLLRASQPAKGSTGRPFTPGRTANTEPAAVP